MQYRREIDGLRAVAVLPVILFHAGFEHFSGGFVGVDVFFVISGYLITTIILLEMEQGRFSIVGFYERRARRILPALFLVMLACLPFAWAWLLAGDMEDFAQSLLGVSLFSSNILFWQESDYFAAVAERKPLLHTWSLAVEEQYYLLFPPFLMLIWALRRRWIFGAIVALGIVSFALAQWGAYNKPIATFFLLPTRAWELMLGGAAAFLLLYARPVLARVTAYRPLQEGLGLAGLALIAFAVAAYDETLPFPSAYAIVPTTGTALVILFAQAGTVAARVLGLRWLVGVGLISYSAYLWHQPLFAFARHRSVEEPSHGLYLALSAAAIVLAYLSWRFVEKPFRDRTHFSRRTVFTVALGGSLLFIVLGLFGSLGGGLTWRWDANQAAILSFEDYPKDAHYREGRCFRGPNATLRDFPADCFGDSPPGEGILLWGDSHAATLYPGLAARHAGVTQLTSSGCPPLSGYATLNRPHCAGLVASVLGLIAERRPRVILLHANWAFALRGDKDIDAEAAFRQVRHAAPDARIVVLGDVPHWEPSLPVRLFRAGADLRDGLYLRPGQRSAHEIAAAERVFARAAAANGFEFVSLHDIMCRADGCLAAVGVDGEVEPTAWDYGHLTRLGSSWLWDRLDERLGIGAGQAE